jgi:hypothetical protein
VGLEFISVSLPQFNRHPNGGIVGPNSNSPIISLILCIQTQRKILLKYRRVEYGEPV